ncbi:hypothetical protein ES703_114784 [subsurface metagenome]
MLTPVSSRHIATASAGAGVIRPAASSTHSFCSAGVIFVNISGVSFALRTSAIQFKRSTDRLTCTVSPYASKTVRSGKTIFSVLISRPILTDSMRKKSNIDSPALIQTSHQILSPSRGKSARSSVHKLSRVALRISAMLSTKSLFLNLPVFVSSLLYFSIFLMK